MDLLDIDMEGERYGTFVQYYTVVTILMSKHWKHAGKSRVEYLK